MAAIGLRSNGCQITEIMTFQGLHIASDESIRLFVASNWRSTDWRASLDRVGGHPWCASMSAKRVLQLPRQSKKSVRPQPTCAQPSHASTSATVRSMCADSWCSWSGCFVDVAQSRPCRRSGKRSGAITTTSSTRNSAYLLARRRHRPPQPARLHEGPPDPLSQARALLSR